ncbi:UDP-N-acetylmuramate--L-alanine ligase [Lactovum odontotermitis]
MSKTYHFTGIKGAGMSALALLLHQMGKNVQGSDDTKYYFTQRGLEQAGIPILPFSAKNIRPEYELIVGNAFRADNNVEVAFAERNNFPFKRYHQFLGEFMQNFISIGVAGAHGKTSTTGMLSHILSNLEDTSYLIGDGTGQGHKDAKYFVFESDEYERHFMPYHPEYSIITNIDFDHPDYFHDIDDVFSAFQDYANQIKNAVFAFGEDKYLRKLKSKTPIFYYGVGEDDDYQARDIVRTTTGSTFTAYFRGVRLGEFTLPAFGKHNVMNALAVIAVLHQLGEDMAKSAEYLTTFKGVKRRFSEKKINDIVIIDDFAHHPTEIEATLDAARQKYPEREIVAVFQPHTFTRTIALLDEFAEVLNHADSVYLAEIYGSAREVDHHDVNIHDLADKIQKPAKVIPENDISPLLNHDQAVYVFMGAGDIQKYEYAFEELLAQLTTNTL